MTDTTIVTLGWFGLYLLASVGIGVAVYWLAHAGCPGLSAFVIEDEEEDR